MMSPPSAGRPQRPQGRRPYIQKYMLGAHVGPHMLAARVWRPHTSSGGRKWRRYRTGGFEAIPGERQPKKPPAAFLLTPAKTGQLSTDLTL